MICACVFVSCCGPQYSANGLLSLCHICVQPSWIPRPGAEDVLPDVKTRLTALDERVAQLREEALRSYHAQVTLVRPKPLLNVLLTLIDDRGRHNEFMCADFTRKSPSPCQLRYSPCMPGLYWLCPF